MSERIVVGMSGGVDSSVAAALLQQQGWSVIGVTLHLWDYQREGHAGRCCAPEDQYDAARVCGRLDIPHFTFDRRALFREAVVEGFVADYAAGRTPSPCVRCNESVKLGPLLEVARSLGASRVATGHYARVSGRGADFALRTAVDPAKDQSYFLWAAPREALEAAVFPLAELAKPAVREIARGLGLSNAAKPDSTDLCFLEGEGHAAFISRHGLAPRAGVIETAAGEPVGRHEGVHAFTVGQRRGVGASGAPRYVLRIAPERAAVIVGDAREAEVRGMRVRDARWLVDAPPREAVARIRYRHAGARVSIERDGPTVTARFAAPERGVAPGQAAVFYDGDRVLGGGWIDEALP